MEGIAEQGLSRSGPEKPVVNGVNREASLQVTFFAADIASVVCVVLDSTAHNTNYTKVNRIHQVQHSAERLREASPRNAAWDSLCGRWWREAHDLRSQLELASEEAVANLILSMDALCCDNEARKTEANAKMARAGLHARPQIC